MSTLKELYKQSYEVEIGLFKSLDFSKLENLKKETLRKLSEEKLSQNIQNEEQTAKVAEPRSTRLTRSALKEKNVDLTEKNIKQEKLSVLQENVNKEAEIMPAPTTLPPKKKTRKQTKNETEGVERVSRSTRSKTADISANVKEEKMSIIADQSVGLEPPSQKKRGRKKKEQVKTEKQTNDDSGKENGETTKVKDLTIFLTRSEDLVQVKEEVRSSDVIVADKSIVTIDLSESIENVTEEEIVQEARKTRGKTKETKTNSDTVPAEKKKRNGQEDEGNPKKKSKSDSSPDDSIAATVYEDAVSGVGGALNGTYAVADNVHDIMTDDDSPLKVDPVKTKPVFSAYEQSPVKSKVAAFEKLVKSNIPKAKATPNSKSKVVTPSFQSTRILKGSTNPVHKTIDRTDSKQTKSATRGTLDQYKEREKKRLEKEKEAEKKRAEKLKAQALELKKKNEEKQLKAQQHREALEKDKKLHMEQKLKEERAHLEQKLKEEKAKALQAKKEEKEKKAQEERQRAQEEKERAAEEREREKKIAAKKIANKPIYLREPLPLLPTPDPYDSDDDRRRTCKRKPAWELEITPTLLHACAVCSEAKNLFYFKNQNPDLREILGVVNPERLKRTSSAVWHKPPKLTLTTIDEV